MEVKEMTISDVLKTPEFYNNLKVVISDLENIRRNARISANAPLKRHPIDRLQGYSSSERKFILEVGGEAFNITMKRYMWRYKNEKA